MTSSDFPVNSTIEFLPTGFNCGTYSEGQVFRVDSDTVYVLFTEGNWEGLDISTLEDGISKGFIRLTKALPPPSFDPTANFNCSDMFE